MPSQAHNIKLTQAPKNLINVHAKLLKISKSHYPLCKLTVDDCVAKFLLSISKATPKLVPAEDESGSANNYFWTEIDGYFLTEIEET